MSEPSKPELITAKEAAELFGRTRFVPAPGRASRVAAGTELLDDLMPGWDERLGSGGDQGEGDTSREWYRLAKPAGEGHKMRVWGVSYTDLMSGVTILGCSCGMATEWEDEASLGEVNEAAADHLASLTTAPAATEATG